MRIGSPCMDCGTPCSGTRCGQCAKNDQRVTNRSRLRQSRKKAASARGYDHAWTKLSRRARERQPFCSDCGATEDLQADHSPEAWIRKAQGRVLRLRDIDVVCGPCNRARGCQRPSQTPGGRPPRAGARLLQGGAPNVITLPGSTRDTGGGAGAGGA